MKLSFLGNEKALAELCADRREWEGTNGEKPWENEKR